ncbi:MAG: secretion protein [Ruminococcus sp.]|nr:secretion protein [Ruminococcus sp.]
MVPAIATESKVEIAESVCDTPNTDVLSTLNSSDIQKLIEQYNCNVKDLENIASDCVKDIEVKGTTEGNCKDNSLIECIKDKLNQSKGRCETTVDCKSQVSDNKTTATECTEKTDTNKNQTAATECQDNNCVSDYVEKAKELLENKSEVKAEEVKEFCNSVNNSSNKKVICSAINSDELKNLLKKFGCSFDYEQSTTVPTAPKTEPTEKTEPSTDSSSNGNNVNNSGNNNSNSNSNSNSENQNNSNTNNNVSSVSEYEKRVVELVNDIRVENGLSKLTLNSELSSVARLKSQDMKDKNYFSHTSPTYGSPFDMMKQFGISYKTAGENIAYGYATPESVVNGWMNSPGHRANILNSSYKEIGVGYVANGHYWTQMFIG